MRSSSVLRSTSCAAVLLALSGVLSLPPAGAQVVAPAPLVIAADVEAVGFGAPGWAFKQVTTANPETPLGEPTPADAEFAAPQHPTTDWLTGTAPFGTAYYPCGGFPVAVTPWDLRTDLLLRRPLSLPAGATNVRVEGTVDNDAAVYVNGSLVGVASSGNCVRGEIAMTVPAAFLARENVLAVRAHDYGVATFFDLRVVYDLAGADAPPVITPVPDQLRELLDRVDGVPGMAAQVRGVMAKLADGRPGPAAQQLSALRAHVVALEGTQLTAEEAASLLAVIDALLGVLAPAP